MLRTLDRPRILLSLLAGLLVTALLTGALPARPSWAQERQRATAQATPAPATPVPTAPPVAPTPPAAPAPLGTGTAGPLPTQPTADRNDIEGTVASVAPADRSVTINADGGALEIVTLPENVPVVRNGQPGDASALEATDRIVVRRGEGDAVQGVFAVSVPPTAVPSPTAAPGATTTAAPATTEVFGSVTAVEGTILSIEDPGAEAPRRIQTRNVKGLEITRDEAGAQLRDIKVGDEVAVTLGADNRPVRIAASAVDAPEDAEDAAPAGVSRWATLGGLLFAVLPLLALILLMLLRRRTLRPVGFTRRR